jgi:hypothetical protein
MHLAESERDLRLDLFRGLALWLIFLDHIPSNIVSWITIRRVQQRNRDLRLHLRLYGRLRLSGDHAKAWLRGGERPHHSVAVTIFAARAVDRG